MNGLFSYAAAIFLLVTGAILSLLFQKRPKLASITSGFFGGGAALTGLVFSIKKLVTCPGEKLNYTLNTSIDLLTVHISIDDLSAFFILVVSLLTLVVSIYSIGYMKHYYNVKNIGYFGFLYGIFIASMLLVVTTGQIFVFIIVWELMSAVSYFLVVYEHENIENQKAGALYIIMTHIGTAFIIAAFILLYKYCGTAVISEMNPELIPSGMKNTIFILLLIGFGTKAGIIPLHVWLPGAHPAAPSNISALMSGVMIKTAVYGIIRFVLGGLGDSYLWWGAAVLILGAASAVLGISYALMENNIKRLLAYSSVENMGVVLIGLGLCMIAASRGKSLIAALALTAALFHVLNHSLFKGLMFLGAGAVHYSTGIKNMEKLGGLIKKMPYTSVFVLAGVLSISALPPFNGFVSEWLTYQALFANINTAGSWISILVILSAALLALAGTIAAYSFIKIYGVSFLALPRSPHSGNAREVPGTMLAGMGILSGLCLLTGIFPLSVLKLIDPLTAEVAGQHIAGSISGAAGFITYRLDTGMSSVSMPAAVTAGALIGIIVFALVRVLSAKSRERRYGTWDCGYRGLNPRMQYTSTGFSKPLRIVFRGIYRPQRELEIDEGRAPYFIKSATYRVSTHSLIDRHLYEQVARAVKNFARKFRFLIQTGSVHTYLVYIFLVVIAMLIYYAKA